MFLKEANPVYKEPVKLGDPRTSTPTFTAPPRAARKAPCMAPRQELLATSLREPRQEPFQGVLRAPLTGPRMALLLGSFLTSSGSHTDPLKDSRSLADAFRASLRGSSPAALAALALALAGPGWSWRPLLSCTGIPPASSSPGALTA